MTSKKEDAGQLSSSQQSETQPPLSGTVRQTRPMAQSGRNYGSLSQPIPSDFETRSDVVQPERSSRADAVLSPSLGSSSHTEKPRKPSMTRRISKRQVPHKGQEFSTDDDLREVEEDIAIQHGPIPQSSPRLRPLRTQSSTLKRRSTPRHAVSRLDSEDDEQETTLPDPGVEASGAISASEDLEHASRCNEEETSDAESFTLKDRQQAINETHPFGIRIWKPALYKKSRSVEKTAEGDIHSSPGGRVSNVLFLVNLLWSLFFGWWLAFAALLGATACFLFGFTASAPEYGRVFLSLSWYLFYPFGSFVRLQADDNYAEEDEGEGRSISEYEQWQNGDIEHGGLFFGPRRDRSLVGRRRNSVDSASEQDSLLGRTQRGHSQDSVLHPSKRRLFGRGEWTVGRVIFFLFFYSLVGPSMLLASGICWLLVFWIPMGRVTIILFNHLRRHPLALSFHSDTTYTRFPPSSSSILLCTYRAAGLRYWKYTIDGTNIFLFNMLAIVVFVIADHFLLAETLHIHNWLTNAGLIFALSLISVIPLAYFIGQAVASISAQSSMGMGAAVNAFFSTVIEVYLYCIALTQGKSQLVEGSIIGSIFAGILFLPGLSMCFGAIKRKTQRFNVKSAGVTSTMLLFSIIAAFSPTLFYQIYGSHELNCRSCTGPAESGQRDCRRCYFSQVPAINDDFFKKAVQPYAWSAAVFLFLSYIIGLWFTLRTHAALIWASEPEERKATTLMHEAPFEPRHYLFPHGSQGISNAGSGSKDSIRDSQLYKRILGQSLRQVGLSENPSEDVFDRTEGNSLLASPTPHVVPPNESHTSHQAALTDVDNENLVRRVTEAAATAATVAACDATRPRKLSTPHTAPYQNMNAISDPPKLSVDGADETEISHEHGGGHDAPNWSKTKSSIILLAATILYAVIAEILVNTVDVVLESSDVDEKFLGIALFSLVPNTTEFLNAISFAMNGNIALSMEIGSAYALQVCLLQIPALVLFSAIYDRHFTSSELLSHSFNLIFPQWDMVTVILCVVLLSYIYGEGKSNYFKGSILLLTYVVIVMGFYLAGFSSIDVMGVDRFDTLALGSERSQKFYTIGRTSSGVAY